MASYIGRRKFLATLGGAAAWPLAARAQRPSIPVIGFLDATTAADTIYRVSAFRDGLKEAGFIDGHNVAIEFRWAENKLDRLPALAADLVQRQVAVIVGPNITMHAARAATPTIPIVFISGGDPIESGLVKIPQLAVRDTTGAEIPAYFNIWRWILPKLTSAERGGRKSNPKPEAILKYAYQPIAMLGALWNDLRREWEARDDEDRPPVFIHEPGGQ